MEPKGIDLSAKLVNLDGKPLTDSESKIELTVGRVLASILALTTESKDPLRDWILSKKLMEAKGSLELDTAEISHLKDAVTNAPNYLVLAKGQLLEKLV